MGFLSLAFFVFAVIIRKSVKRSLTLGSRRDPVTASQRIQHGHTAIVAQPLQALSFDSVSVRAREKAKCAPTKQRKKAHPTQGIRSLLGSTHTHNPPPVWPILFRCALR